MMMKRSIKTTLCVACSSVFLLGSASCALFEVDSNSVKNVILVIGDGMGNNHLENALTYFDLEDPVFMQDKIGDVFTYSANASVTDSAAAATAMSTGQKVNNSSIAYSVEGKKLTSISTLAKNAGKKVGIVTTDTLDGATPAAFSSHALTRTESETIARGQAQSDIDLFIGQSSSAYVTTYTQFFTQNGYDVTNGAGLPNAETFKSEKYVGLITGVRSAYNDEFTAHYQLKDMAAFAVDYLEKENENGYFLMIEGAYIDKCSHSNQLIPALCEARSLFDTLTYLYERVGDDTAILFTADHETGGLRKETKKDKFTDNLYSSTNHTNALVPLFAKNVTLSETKDLYENTEIFELCKKMLKV